MTSNSPQKINKIDFSSNQQNSFSLKKGFSAWHGGAAAAVFQQWLLSVWGNSLLKCHITAVPQQQLTTVLSLWMYRIKHCITQGGKIHDSELTVGNRNRKMTSCKNTSHILLGRKWYFLLVYLTFPPNLPHPPASLEKTCTRTSKLTLVEFLLGAVIGQSGSAGFRQGRSI